MEPQWYGNPSGLNEWYISQDAYRNSLLSSFLMLHWITLFRRLY